MIGGRELIGIKAALSLSMNTTQIKAIREIATKSTAYAFTLKFTREFTSGSLKGTTHEDSIGFCKAADCDEWVSSVNSANKAGKLNYKVVSWKVEG